MTTTTNLAISLPTVNSPVSADIWGDDLNTAITTLDAEAATKTVNLNFADKVLSRPEIKDFGYTTNGAFPNATGAVTIDIAATGNVYSCTATGNLTFTFSNPSASGVFCPLLVAVKQDGTGSRTITWPGSVNGTPTTATTTAGKVDFYQFGTWNGGTTWYILGERIGQ